MPSHQPRKRFGQHFLRDPGAVQRIVRAIHPQPGEHLVEIGPGLGAITLPLLRSVHELDVVELDRDIIPLIRQRCQARGELRIHQADAVGFDFSRLRRDQRLLRIVGNLPYNISTPLLFHLLEQSWLIQDMHFMLQKEVVERMAAAAGTAHYGRLSVMLQYRCRITPLFFLGSQAFAPPPKVESAFVRLVPHAYPPVQIHHEACFSRLVRQAFSQRRKTLRNTLRPLLDATEITAAGIDPGTRPQTLTLADFAALSNRLSPPATGE